MGLRVPRMAQHRMAQHRGKVGGGADLRGQFRGSDPDVVIGRQVHLPACGGREGRGLQRQVKRMGGKLLIQIA